MNYSDMVELRDRKLSGKDKAKLAAGIIVAVIGLAIIAFIIFFFKPEPAVKPDGLILDPNVLELKDGTKIISQSVNGFELYASELSKVVDPADMDPERPIYVDYDIVSLTLHNETDYEEAPLSEDLGKKTSKIVFNLEYEVSGDTVKVTYPVLSHFFIQGDYLGETYKEGDMYHDKDITHVKGVRVGFYLVDYESLTVNAADIVQPGDESEAPQKP